MDVGTNGEVSFWYADMGGVPGYRPPLPGDISVDVCIVGAGFTGLWTAYYLKEAEPGLSIAIVEKEFAGFGASGRNGGWCSGEFGWSRHKYLSSGSRAGVIEFERQLRATVDEVKRVTEAEGIDCDFRLTDCLTFAQTPAQMARLRADYETAMSWQVPTTRLELIGGAEAAARIRVPDAKGALVRHHVARVQPAKLVRGLAEAVERRGVAIYEQTTVTGIAKGLVTTNRGRVTAHRIIRATEGFTHGIPGNEREWLPMNSAIVVTEPLPDDLWREIGWEDHQLLADASHAYCYAQRTRGNRIAMGGRGVPYRFGSKTDTRGQTQPETIEKLKDILYRMLPQTRGLRLDHAWCGVLGVPRDWCATAGMDPQTGIGWAGGYVGLGVSTSNFSGQTLADLVLDRQTERTALPWVNRRPRKWEVEPFRWLGVHGMYWLYHRADRNEAAGGGKTTSRLATWANRLTGR
ncbi:glycine/D-amino acid oxidase-like deaminating enzyme [Gemmobacter caeni]|uniref:Glycine/D-amino acid oxidase-like deaminating enzyme n=1 Tax=Gemmobacter caeni TaxID=589035 RepID=A0A2T6AZW7_9RHOB|nr:FAD-binding oxidoreductase [Gemmobacter caeni]PTX49358.1 glycine/D-amino acid oxidase-like deaminating enzyme [Gemmobacter caeni]TWJ00344.1 glycine/D-amino acid oxidase-like deaminating enzyme [Gemmobacter caeni]